jgi:uncharacterized membrane protein YhaH (DUF805 family)
MGGLSVAVNPHGFLQLLFSFRGRIRRRVFWAVFVPNVLLLIVCWDAVEWVGGSHETIEHARMWGNDVAPIVLRDALSYALPVAIVALAWIALATLCKRFHDEGSSGWTALCLLIPIYSLFVWIQVGFIRGKRGTNEYGPDPRGEPNTACSP